MQAYATAFSSVTVGDFVHAWSVWPKPDQAKVRDSVSSGNWLGQADLNERVRNNGKSRVTFRAPFVYRYILPRNDKPFCSYLCRRG